MTSLDVEESPDPAYDIARYRPSSEASFMIGVPIWFTAKHELIDPGISFEARFAHRFGLVAPELTVGWQINWLNEDKLPSRLKGYNLTIDSLYFSLGARLYMVERGKVQPFVSGAFDLAFWHLTGNTSTVCGYYYCTSVANYDAGIGLSGRAGVAFLATDYVQFEVGARVAMAFPVGPVDQVEAWVAPYLGFVSRF